MTESVDAHYFLVGDDEGNVIQGAAGNDTIYGGGGDDLLEGGDGADKLVGGFGDDTLLGGTGDDIMVGRQGVDHYDGGDGDDNVCYSAADQFVLIDLASGASAGAASGETWLSIEGVTGTAFNDTLLGDDNRTWFSALDGDDLVDGRGGDDVLLGQGGSDTIRGGSGNDHVNGGDGADILYGDTGIDEMAGGTGSDIFVINAGTMRDYVLDFETGIDEIQLDSSMFADFTSFMAHSWMEGSSLVAEAMTGDLVIIRDIDPSRLSAGDFLFV